MKKPRWKMSRLRPSQGGKFADPCGPSQEVVNEVRRGKAAKQDPDGIAVLKSILARTKPFAFLAESYFNDLPGAFFDPSIIKHKAEERGHDNDQPKPEEPGEGTSNVTRRWDSGADIHIGPEWTRVKITQDSPKITQEFHPNGQLWWEEHRLDGELHNENGPAYRRCDSKGDLLSESYHLYGKLYNENGPAFGEWDYDGNLFYEEYWVDGKKLTKGGWAKLCGLTKPVFKAQDCRKANRLVEDYWRASKCECGADTTHGSGDRSCMHSTWCPQYIRLKL